ncbi:RhoGEF domain [Carpediemonas membranifera]|uniref:RhoGEF domain n=1 Tax=Carpediemonas membranifera TaxID=201153 RepID=A0A8J6EBJ8_9EUKA|nr:RhoGEF domain [Carpediemonas membranifera]|eukprot:KAG9397405.1 RhoGEF domain [Carpediemonas membranifera]
MSEIGGKQPLKMSLKMLDAVKMSTYVNHSICCHLSDHVLGVHQHALMILHLSTRIHFRYSYKNELPFPEVHRACQLNGVVYALPSMGASFASFDLATRQWTKLADLPTTALVDFAMTAADDCVFVHGGKGKKALYVYDIADDAWTKHNTDFSAAGHAAGGRYLLHRTQFRRIVGKKLETLPDCPIEAENAQLVETADSLTVLAGGKLASFGVAKGRWVGTSACEPGAVLGVRDGAPVVVVPLGQCSDVGWLSKVQISNDFADILRISGINPDSPDLLTAKDLRGRTVLHLASSHRPEIVSDLISGGCSVNQLDKCSLPPLVDAVVADNYTAATALMKGGADPSFVTQDMLEGRPDLAELLRTQQTVVAQSMAPRRTHPSDRVFQAIATRVRIANEIRDTERTYVDAMRFMVDTVIPEFVARSEQRGWPKQLKNPSDVFANVDQFISANVELLARLDERLLDFDPTETAIGDIFVHTGAFFKMYKEYIKTYDSARELLQITSLALGTLFHRVQETPLTNYKDMLRLTDTHPLVAGFLDWVKCHPDNASHHDLLSLLIMPVQRVPRYTMLLAELIKRTDDGHPDMENLRAALKIMNDVADSVNAHMSEQERRDAVMGLKSSISNWNDVADCLALPQRQLYRRGQLHRQTANGEWRDRQHVLLSDVLFYISRGKLNVEKAVIPLCVAFVREGENENEIVISTPMKTTTLSANTPIERDEWLRDIQMRLNAIEGGLVGVRAARERLERRMAAAPVATPVSPLTDEWMLLIHSLSCALSAKIGHETMLAFIQDTPEADLSLAEFNGQDSVRVGSFVVRVGLDFKIISLESGDSVDYLMGTGYALPFPEVHRACQLNGVVYALPSMGASFASFDLATRQWTKLADLPTTALVDFAMTAADDCVFVHGGKGKKALYVYDIADDAWTKHNTDFSAAGHAAGGRYLLHRTQFRRIVGKKLETLPDCPIEAENAQLVETADSLTVLAGGKLASFDVAKGRWVGTSACEPGAVLGVRDGTTVSIETKGIRIPKWHDPNAGIMPWIRRAATSETVEAMKQKLRGEGEEESKGIVGRWFKKDENT